MEKNMSKTLVIQHDLSALSEDQLTQYKRDVSVFIGLDPDLNGLDTVWMPNENGPGKSLVLYARRGTAEILRNIKQIEVTSLTNSMVKGSIVFTAIGRSEGRQEIATGSKYIEQLAGRALDDAIMTASTRALRRLTMQFTSLAILDESEVRGVQGNTDNPAAGAQLAGSPVVIPPVPSVPANNAPGKDITPPAGIPKIPDAPDTRHAVAAPLVNQDDNLKKVYAEGAAALAAMPKPADIQPDATPSNTFVTPVVAPVTGMNITDIKSDKPKRARKKPNTVSMDGPEPEVVNKPAQPEQVVTPVSQPVQAVPVPAPAAVPPAAPVEAPVIVPTQAVAAVPTQANPASTEFPGKPTNEQMTDYRKRVSVYTSELPSSEGMGSVQKMRAFITHMSGTAPQFMTTEQWEEMLGFFESFVAKNQVKGLVKYINDSLGVK
jgi:hypothetical protein